MTSSARMAVLTAALCGTLIPVGALAQATGDVVVMRRIIAKPVKKLDVDSTVPSGNASYKATSYTVASPMTSDTAITLIVGGVKCYNAGQVVNAGQCANSAPAQGTGNRTVPALLNPVKRTVVIDESAVTAVTGGLTGNACAATTRRGSQAWKVSCNPDDRTIPDAVRLATSVTAVADQTMTNGTLGVLFDGIRCYDRDNAIVTGDCSTMPIGGTVGAATLKATMREELRTLLIDPDEVSAASWPVDTQTICSSSVRMSTAQGSQTWKVRCDPAEITVHYQKYPTMAYVTETVVPGTRYLVDTASSGVRCLDTDTGQLASNQSKCDYLPAPSNVGLLSVPMASNATTRTVAVNRQDILALAPSVTNLDQFCMGRTPVIAAGAKQSWYMRCGIDDVNRQYEKTVAEISDPMGTAGGWSNPSNYSDAIRAKTYTTNRSAMTIGIYSITCWDKANDNKAVDQAQCTYLADGPVHRGSFDVPAAYSANMRTVVIDRADVQAYAPNLTDAQLTALCTTSYTIAGGTWKVRCDPREVEEHYEKYATAVSDPRGGTSYPNRYANDSFNPTSLTIGISDIGCWDTSTNAISTDASMCTYLPTGPRMYDSIVVSAKSSVALRTVAIKRSDVQAALPRLSVAQLNALCTSSYTFGKSTDAAQAWKVRCDEAEIDNHYEKYVASIVDPSDYITQFKGNSTINKVTPPTSLNIGIWSVGCWDTLTNARATDQSKCTYLPTGPVMYDMITVPVQPNAELRTMYLKREDLLAAAPRLPESYIAEVCNDTYGISAASGFQDWKVRCNASEIVNTYEKYVASIVDPSDYSTQFRANSTINKVVPPTSLNIGIWSVQCWDRATNARATDQSKCTFLPGGPVTYDMLTIPAQSNTDLRTMYVKREDLISAAPRLATSAVNALCAETYGFSPSTGFQDWKVKCDASEIVNTYERYVSNFADPASHSNYGANRYGNTSTSPTSLNVGNHILACWDTSINADAADQSKCNYLAGPTRYAITTIPVQSNPDLRTMYASRADIQAAFPRFTTSVINNMCTSSYSLGSEATLAAWKLRCNPDEIVNHYERYAYSVVDVSSYSGFGANRYANSSLTPASLVIGTINIQCWDTRTGAIASDASKCTYLPNGPQTYSVKSIRVRYNAATMKLVMDKAEVQQAFPHMIDQYVNDACTRKYAVGPQGSQQQWTASCNPADAP